VNGSTFSVRTRGLGKPAIGDDTTIPSLTNQLKNPLKATQ